MARPYSKEFIRELECNPSTNLGVELAKLCVNANLPAAYVASALGTSRITVYSWFRGQGIREEKRTVVEALISLIKQDLDAKVLPIKTLPEAKMYIENLAGVKI